MKKIRDMSKGKKTFSGRGFGILEKELKRDHELLKSNPWEYKEKIDAVIENKKRYPEAAIFPKINKTIFRDIALTLYELSVSPNTVDNYQDYLTKLSMVADHYAGAGKNQWKRDVLITFRENLLGLIARERELSFDWENHEQLGKREARIDYLHEKGRLN